MDSDLLTNISQALSYFYNFPDRDFIEMGKQSYTKAEFAESLRPLLPPSYQNITDPQALIEALYTNPQVVSELQQFAQNEITESQSATSPEEQPTDNPNSQTIKEPPTVTRPLRRRQIVQENPPTPEDSPTPPPPRENYGVRNVGKGLIQNVGTLLGNMGWTGIGIGARAGNFSTRVLTNISTPRPGVRAVTKSTLGKKELLFIFGLIGAFLGIGFFTLLFSGSQPTTPTPSSSSGNNQITTSKGFVGVNIPNLVNQPQSEIDHILSYLSSSCGTTVIRTFFTSDQLNVDSLKNLLATGQKYNIKFIIALADFPNRPNDLLPFGTGDNPTGWYKDQYQGRYLQHVKDTVTATQGSSAIYGWELMNEPHCQGDSNCSQYYSTWVKAVSSAIRSWDPNTSHMISIGTQANNDINFGDSVSGGEYEANNSASFITALTGHYYDGSIQGDLDDTEFQKQKTLMLQDLEIAKKLNKPFYIGEAGFVSTGDRADRVKQEMDEFFSKGATGYLIWQYSDRPQIQFDRDAFSFYENDAMCNVMKQQAQKLVVTVSTSVNSCQFVRGDQTPPAATYQSPKLMSYFEEASQLSSVPSTVLAAIARVESPGVTQMTDAQIDNYACAISPTGARGIMQLQPPGTTGSYADGIALGASFLGKPADQLTIADFCDPRENIILASGFILKKLAAFGYGDGTHWDPSWTNDSQIINTVAKGYYGCLNYPNCTSGPYSYGQDIYNSIQSCQSTSGQVNISGTDNDRIAQAAEQIANQLMHNLKDANQIKNLGITCDGANGRPLQAGQYNGNHCWDQQDMQSYDIAQDPYYLQCTEFVIAAFDKAGYKNQIMKIKNGNARDWANNARNDPTDFAVFTDPNDPKYQGLQPGDVISLGKENVAGHLAIVIRRDQNRVYVAQSATDVKLEQWIIDPDTGKLNAMDPGSGTRATTYDSGFIRLINHTVTSGSQI